MSVASAGPYASLQLAPDRQPHQHPTTQFFTGRMPFLPANQQRQSTEGDDNDSVIGECPDEHHDLWGMEQSPLSPPSPHHDDTASTSRLQQLIADVRGKLTMDRELVTQMPRSLCATLTSSAANERRCWNGTSYTRCICMSPVRIRYDTIRDAILTCARKPTRVSLIYRTEPTTKKCRNRKN